MHRQVLKHNGAQCPFSGACFKINTYESLKPHKYFLSIIGFARQNERTIVHQNIKVPGELVRIFFFGHFCGRGTHFPRGLLEIYI